MKKKLHIGYLTTLAIMVTATSSCILQADGDSHSITFNNLTNIPIQIHVKANHKTNGVKRVKNSGKTRHNEETFLLAPAQTPGKTLNNEFVGTKLAILAADGKGTHIFNFKSNDSSNRGLQFLEVYDASDAKNPKLLKNYKGHGLGFTAPSGSPYKQAYIVPTANPLNIIDNAGWIYAYKYVPETI